jgi:hypothetical protein
VDADDLGNTVDVLLEEGNHEINLRTVNPRGPRYVLVLD